MPCSIVMRRDHIGRRGRRRQPVANGFCYSRSPGDLPAEWRPCRASSRRRVRSICSPPCSSSCSPPGRASRSRRLPPPTPRSCRPRPSARGFPSPARPGTRSRSGTGRSGVRGHGGGVDDREPPRAGGGGNRVRRLRPRQRRPGDTAGDLCGERGPGAASAYLHLGALGPWLLPMDGRTDLPLQAVGLDPTGAPGSTSPTWSSSIRSGPGSADWSTPTTAARPLSLGRRRHGGAGRLRPPWLIENGRLASPKSSSPRATAGSAGRWWRRELQTDRGVGLDGMILLSPVLDFGWWRQPDHGPLPMASLLPSLAAARMEASGAFAAEPGSRRPRPTPPETTSPTCCAG